MVSHGELVELRLVASSLPPCYSLKAKWYNFNLFEHYCCKFGRFGLEICGAGKKPVKLFTILKGDSYGTD